MEQIDDVKISRIYDSDLNSFNNSIRNIFKIDKCKEDKQKGTDENSEDLEEKREGSKIIPTIQEQLLLMQDFSDDDEEEEEEYRRKELEEEEMTSKNSIINVTDGKDQHNSARTKNIHDGSKELFENSLDDIMNMELPEDSISEDEHDGKEEDASKGVENSVDEVISD